MSADLYFTRVSFFFLLLSSFFFFFAAWSPRSLNGTERKSATWSEVSVIYKLMSEIWDTPPTNRGPKNHLFWTTSQLNGNFNGLYLRNERRYRQSVKCVDNYKGLLHCPKCHELWSTNGFKLDLQFCPPYVNSAFCFIARLRRRRAAKGTQPNFAKRWMVGRANNLP